MEDATCWTTDLSVLSVAPMNSVSPFSSLSYKPFVPRVVTASSGLLHRGLLPITLALPDALLTDGSSIGHQVIESKACRRGLERGFATATSTQVNWPSNIDRY